MKTLTLSEAVLSVKCIEKEIGLLIQGEVTNLTF